ncbi:MAG: hypothetical protein COV10_00645 [Candidatus Vogelbacteria bacterium CG10_big_fil_rev_8_21_14_0_10_51_16]|uniref:DUF7282 domain-containing protein n=1 Tax=Candidatus Vogelbacteria bacterium CG10_big_fil_rev_8_21_14_0_10_51_16 TaxID=1975045 RepID=A0A2H0RF37_9BACT|nr:MAG: hypothetical protein COV10_00645 [Candidatus Vogelbacteria bacterium CG10_big_fil_rev_8_21_14_0_10_51_16]
MIKKILWLVVVVLVVWGVYVLATKDQNEAPAEEVATEANFAVAAGDQKPGSEVKVGLAILAEPAFLVVHREEDSAPGAIVGVSGLLTVGTHSDLSISLSRAAQSGETLYVMAHRDTNGNGIFDYAADASLDVPSVDSQSRVVMTMVLVR